MEWIITVHVDEGDKEFLATPTAKAALDQAIYRTIQSLKSAHYDKLSRQSVMGRGYQGTAK